MITVNAESAKAACDRVEADILGWGTEYNWHNILGSVSDKDEFYIHAERNDWHEETNTIAKINAAIVDQMRYDNKCDNEIIRESLRKWLDGGPSENVDWWRVEEMAEIKQQLPKNLDTFDILAGHEYRPHELDHVGVTDFRTGEPLKAGDRTYVVFVDMHH